MERDFLKKLGLDDDTTDKVMAQYGKDIQAYKDKAEKLDQANTQIDGLKDQLDQQTKQFKELQKTAGNNDELKSQLDKALANSKEMKKTLEDKLASQKKNFAIGNALRDAGAKDAKLVESLIDTDKVSFDDNGNLIGASDQIDAIKKSHDYLFKSDAQPETKHPNVSIAPKGNPSHETNTTIDLKNASYGQVLKFKQEHPDEYKSLVDKEGD